VSAGDRRTTATDRDRGAELGGVHYLRTLADCDALRDRLESDGRVVVVGAGWISSEFAASARQRGLEVTVVDRRATAGRFSAARPRCDR
jgi:3-phenylpropionate/trans-cinnamate dioxygenase ferredoxin reductase subunit